MRIPTSKPNQKCNMYHDIIECLIAALEAKDKYTYGHSNRVADMAYDLVREIGLKDAEQDEMHMAAHVHDIGKIGVSGYILKKKGKLLQWEWKKIKKHPVIGYGILMKSKELSTVAKIVLHHHERWDGNGYPDRLSGDKIPLGSRIISVCDSIDGMISDRPYRKALSWERCLEELVHNKERQFDPDIIEVAMKLVPIWRERVILKEVNF